MRNRLISNFVHVIAIAAVPLLSNFACAGDGVVELNFTIAPASYTLPVFAVGFNTPPQVIDLAPIGVAIPRFPQCASVAVTGVELVVETAAAGSWAIGQASSPPSIAGVYGESVARATMSATGASAAALAPPLQSPPDAALTAGNGYFFSSPLVPSTVSASASAPVAANLVGQWVGRGSVTVSLTRRFTQQAVVGNGAALTQFAVATTTVGRVRFHIRTPPPDVNGDLIVDGADLASILAAWGSANPAADVNGDGVVAGEDLAGVLAAWGPVTCG
jgi:hypothetical protein